MLNSSMAVSAMSSTGDELRVLEFKTFDDALAEVDRLASTPYQRLGNWELAQMCDHLADAFEGSLRGYDFAAPWIIRKALGKFGLWYVLKYRSAPIRPRIPKHLEPPAGKDLQVCIARLRKIVAEFEATEKPLAPHPFFGPMTHAQWRQIHLFHLMHHLRFLVVDDQRALPRGQPQ